MNGPIGRKNYHSLSITFSALIQKTLKKISMPFAY